MGASLGGRGKYFHTGGDGKERAAVEKIEGWGAGKKKTEYQGKKLEREQVMQASSGEANGHYQKTQKKGGSSSRVYESGSLHEKGRQKKEKKGLPTL